MAQNNAITSRYFSGQGILLVADRDTVTGEPQGFRNVGNVPELTLGIEQEVLEHKESTTGQRATDLRLTQETNVSFAATLEHLDPENLALVLYGNTSAVASGSAAAEEVEAFLGATVALDNIDVTNVVVKGPSGTPTYELDKNYRVNAEAGSLFILSDADQTAASATANISASELLEVDYDYAAYSEIDALETGRPEVWFRFEGLNTTEDPQKSVVVEIFKTAVDPLEELALIQDEIAQFTLEGTALQDATRSSGSQFFNVKIANL